MSHNFRDSKVIPFPQHAEALGEMRACGLIIDGPIDTSGKIQRVPTQGKPNKKNGWYRGWEKILPDGRSLLAVTFGDWADPRPPGQWDSFKSWKKPDHGFTPEHVIQANKEYAQWRAEVKAEEERKAKEVAERVAKEWPNLPDIHPDNVYLKEKNVSAHGIKGGAINVYVPVKNADGEFISLQTITPNAESPKTFEPGSNVSGGFHIIGKLSGDNIIRVCEGYATGASIYEIMSGMVVIAFMVWNLKAVSIALRNKYPNAQIHICADDDQWTNGNPGITYAQKAAKAVGGLVFIPQFANLESKPTDFNDLAKLEGKEVVRCQLAKAKKLNSSEAPKKILSLPPPGPQPPPESQPQLESKPEPKNGEKRERGKAGKPKREISPKYVYGTNKELAQSSDGKLLPWKTNVYKILLHDIRLVGKIGWNSFKHEIVKRGDLPFETAKETEWQSHEYIYMAVWIADKYHIQISRQQLMEALDGVAHRNKFHPVQEYLNSLKWDGIPRIDMWLIDFLGAADTEANRLIGSSFLIGAARRIMEPGAKMDNMMVLTGSQGIGKSSALRTIAVKDEWFLDQTLDVRDTEAFRMIQGVWIVEMQELASLRKAESEQVKSFLTKQFDIYRVPYAACQTRALRQCVFAGTSNNKQFLQDHTGNRRFWPVAVTCVKLDELRVVVDQLWAEAMHRRKEDYWIDAAHPALVELQEQCQLPDPWEEKLGSYVSVPHKNDYFLSSDLMEEALGKTVDRCELRDINRLTNIMQKLGYEKTRKRIPGGKRTMVYMPVKVDESD